MPTRQELIDYARQAAQRRGVDAAIFVRQIEQESGFNPAAYNKKSGATGIAQIMPNYHPKVDARDPYASLDYAASLMASHLKQYGGRYDLALAAYNAGPGNVAQYGGVPPFEETQTYVRNILGATSGTGQGGKNVQPPWQDPGEGQGPNPTPPTPANPYANPTSTNAAQEAARQRLEALEAQRGPIEDAWAQANNDLAAANADLEHAQARIDAARTGAKEAASKAAYEQAQAELSQASYDLADATRRRSEATGRRQKAEAEAARLATDLRAANSAYERASRAATDMRETLAEKAKWYSLEIESGRLSLDSARARWQKDLENAKLEWDREYGTAQLGQGAEKLAQERQKMAQDAAEGTAGLAINATQRAYDQLREAAPIMGSRQTAASAVQSVRDWEKYGAPAMAPYELPIIPYDPLGGIKGYLPSETQVQAAWQRAMPISVEPDRPPTTAAQDAMLAALEGGRLRATEGREPFAAPMGAPPRPAPPFALQDTGRVENLGLRSPAAAPPFALQETGRVENLGLRQPVEEAGVNLPDEQVIALGEEAGIERPSNAGSVSRRALAKYYRRKLAALAF